MITKRILFLAMGLFFLSTSTFGEHEVTPTRPMANRPEVKTKRLENGSPLSLSKPTLFYLYSNKRGDLKRSKEVGIAKLRACGFDVREQEIRTLKDIDQLSDSSKQSGVNPFFIFSASHGGYKEDKIRSGAFTFTFDTNSFLGEGYSVDGFSVLSRLNTRFPNSSLFLDTCHAGNCVVGNHDRLGLACKANESSRNQENELTYVEEVVIDILCDSINQCAYFSHKEGEERTLKGNKIPRIDADENSVINGTELNDYFLNAHEWTHFELSNENDKRYTDENQRLRYQIHLRGTTKDFSELVQNLKKCKERKLSISVSQGHYVTFTYSPLKAGSKKEMHTALYADFDVPWPMEKPKPIDPKELARLWETATFEGFLKQEFSRLSSYSYDKEARKLTKIYGNEKRFYQVSATVDDPSFGFQCWGGRQNSEPVNIINMGDRSNNRQCPYFLPDFKISCQKNLQANQISSK